MSGALDPAIHWTLRASLALLFAAAAHHKLRDPGGFRASLADYRLLPGRAIGAVAIALALAEAAVAVGLLTSARAAPAAVAAAGLLSLYALAIGVNLARGRRDLACGCLGPAADRPVHAGLVVRNGVLVGAALLTALPPAPRALTPLDAGTVAAAVVTLAFLYLASEGLLAARRAAAVEARP